MTNIAYSDRLLESEVRAYNNKIKRQKIVRRQRMILFLVLGIRIAAVVIIAKTKVLEAHSEVNDTDYKYYTKVQVKYGDTLRKFAKDYACPSHYRDFDSYEAEVRSINHIGEDDDLPAGTEIIIPYYSTEFKW